MPRRQRRGAPPTGEHRVPPRAAARAPRHGRSSRAAAPSDRGGERVSGARAPPVEAQGLPLPLPFPLPFPLPLPFPFSPGGPPCGLPVEAPLPPLARASAARAWPAALRAESLGSFPLPFPWPLPVATSCAALFAAAD